jgi:sugar phosphate isomerase/epimerase
MDRLGIEFISVFGLPPVEFVGLAADLGCRYIAMGLAPILSNPHNYPRWSLRDDAALRRDTICAMHDRGVSISLGEGFIVRPGADVRDQSHDLDLMGELGIKRVNVLSIDPELHRSFDQFAAFVEMAGKAGMETTLEFGPRLAISNLAAALAAIRHVGQPNFRLLIDTMHFVRSGAGAADLAALAPDMIGYVQLCDAPLVSRYAEYMDEARYDRLAPGAGELPLPDILAALPRDLVLGLEVPMLAQAQAGVGPHERLGPCVKAARDLLARLGT